MSICTSYFDFGVVCVINDYYYDYGKKEGDWINLFRRTRRVELDAASEQEEKREKKIGEDVSRGKRRGGGMRVRHLFPPPPATSHSKNDRV